MSDVVNKLQEGFDEHFEQYRNVPIGIYGIGKNAETILGSIKGYDFQCLIAADHLHEQMYGLEVLSLSEALNRIGLVLIAAIPSSTAIIYDRIKDDVPENVPIVTMHGRILRGDENYRDNEYWKCSELDLYKTIDSHDVISFDIFDTLIMRRVLQPQDVLPLVANRLKSMSFDKSISERFAAARIVADRAMYAQFTSPTIECIYDRLADDLGLSYDKASDIMEIELSVEMSVCIPRKEMVKVLNYAISRGKQVFMTSDMFFGKEDIWKILKSAGLNCNCEVLVSCDYDASKEKGTLYSILKEKSDSTSILHVGDNLEHDISKAKVSGIDTFYVKRSYDILAESSAAFIFDKIKSDADRQMLGYIVSELFNDPFVLNDSKGKLTVRNYRDIACRILPITAVYLAYIIDYSRNYDVLFFASRDGYFLQKMYERIRTSYPDGDLPPSKYVYISRSAVSRAATVSYDDIDVLSNKIIDDPKLNLRDFFRIQFHTELPDEYDMTNAKALDKWGYDGLKKKLRTFYDNILRDSKVARGRYLGYLQNEGIFEFDKPAIIDIVTQGTLVYGLGKIMNKDIDLIAMGTSCVPNRYILDEKSVHSLYGNITERIGDNIHSMTDFSETHLMLEMLYGSTDGQLQGFDEKSKPLFAEGTAYDAELLGGVQSELEEMLNYVIDQDLLGKISKEFAMDVLRLCIRKYSEYSDNIKKCFSFNDPYDGSLKESNLIDYIK